jgi:phage baseplate assembly protein W
MQGMNETTGKPLSGVQHLKQSVQNIFTTRLGARVMRRFYGSNLFNRIDAPINGDLIAEIYSDVAEALFQFEPRFELSALTVHDISEGRIVLDLEGKYLISGEAIKLEGIEIT